MLGDIYEKSERKDLAGSYYAQIVKNYPLSSHDADAKAKLKDFGMPVPQADPKALEWMTAEANTPRPKENVLHKSKDMLHSTPDVHTAAAHGMPNMEPDTDQGTGDLLRGANHSDLGGGSSTGAVVDVVKPGISLLQVRQPLQPLMTLLLFPQQLALPAQPQVTPVPRQPHLLQLEQMQVRVPQLQQRMRPHRDPPRKIRVLQRILRNRTAPKPRLLIRARTKTQIRRNPAAKRKGSRRSCPGDGRTRGFLIRSRTRGAENSHPLSFGTGL